MIGGLFPRRRPAPAHGERCWCRCHAGEAPPPAINGMVAPGVERADPVAAVAACARCQPYHAVALSGDPAALDRAWWAWWSPFSPSREAPPEVVVPLVPNPFAFGGGDGPETV